MMQKQATALFHCKLLFIHFLSCHYPLTLIWHLFTCISPICVCQHTLTARCFTICLKWKQRLFYKQQVSVEGILRIWKSRSLLRCHYYCAISPMGKKKSPNPCNYMPWIFFKLTVSWHTQISPPRISLNISNYIFLQMNRKLQLSGSRSKLLYR